jgi:hypothetical protein
MPLINVFGNVPGAQPGVSSQDFSNVGAGVSDIFAGFAAETRIERVPLRANCSAADAAHTAKPFTNGSSLLCLCHFFH